MILPQEENPRLCKQDCSPPPCQSKAQKAQLLSDMRLKDWGFKGQFV